MKASHLTLLFSLADLVRADVPDGLVPSKFYYAHNATSAIVRREFGFLGLFRRSSGVCGVATDHTCPSRLILPYVFLVSVCML